jgi:hypothetical protein
VSHSYEAFGVAVRANRPLPTLRVADAREPDVVVDFAEGEAPEVDAAASSTTELTGSYSTTVSDDGGRLYRLASHGGERTWSMRVSGDGRGIEVRWSGPVALADIASLVEVTGLPAAVTLRCRPLLHGCAIEAGGAAFVVLGASGAGKSSVAAAALAAGHGVLTDDVAALEASSADVVVHPGGRQLRLNGDTARALGFSPADLGRVFETPELPPKLFAWLPAENVAARSVAAIFVLSGRRAERPEVERLTPAAALPMLLRNTYGNHAADAHVRAALLPFWTRVAQEVPAHLATPPDGLAALPSFVGALTDAAMLPQPCGPPSFSSGRPAS